MDADDLRFVCVSGALLVVAVLCGLQCHACDAECDAWNNRVVACSEQQDPGACRSDLLKSPPAHCSLEMVSSPECGVLIPVWERREREKSAVKP